MTPFNERTFQIPELKGISKKSVEEHLKLYSGYVKNTNLILQKIEEYSAHPEAHAYAIGEIQRRLGFEFNGMRNHEYYFASLEGGAHILDTKSELGAAIEKEWGAFDAWIASIKSIAMTRGIGWAILYFDPVTNRLINAWIDEQHIGQLNGLYYIFGIDMWEHSFYLDYATDKKKYVDAFLENVNWKVIEENYKKASAK